MTRDRTGADDAATPVDASEGGAFDPAGAHLVLAAGTTRTAEIEGISAAGADPDLLVHTPAADAELLATGAVATAPEVPASPTGCPTPAVVTRAAREVLGVGATVVDAGLAAPTGAPAVDVGARPGGDLRDPTAVPGAEAIRSAAREVGADSPGEHLLVAETIPGGTTTALGVLRALGEDPDVSSSLPDNPIDRKRRVVREGLAADGLAPGDCAGDPAGAVEAVGGPVLATATGIAEGALAAGRPVTLAGGTQMLAVAALLRHAGVEDPIRVATTAYVARDPSVDLGAAARSLGVDLTVTDPGFGDHPALARYAAGEGKEGVGMGGVLWLADRAGRLPAVRERARSLVDELGIGSAEGGGSGTADGPPTDRGGSDRREVDGGGP